MKDHYWRLPLPSERVKFVSTEESFAEFHNYLQKATLAGLDAEWKPVASGRSKKSPRVSILQVACRCEQEHHSQEDYVFILDLLVLPPQTFALTLKAFLTSPSSLKLGYAFHDDLRHLAASHPGSSAHGCFDKVSPFLDIGRLFLYHQGLEYQDCEGGVLKERGLSAVSEAILGAKLDKTLQCSNWEERPLSQEQQLYAATDAYSLLAIYDTCCALQRHPAGPSHGPLIKLSRPAQSSVGVASAVDLPYSSTSKPLKQSPKRGSSQKCPSASQSEAQAWEGSQMGSAALMLQRGPAAKVALAAAALVSASDSEDDINTTFSGPLSHLLERLTLTADVSTSHRGAKSGASKRKKKRRDKAQKGVITSGGKYGGPPPWEEGEGGDGEPRFLCDVHVEGLARQLRCVGFDAASAKGPRSDARRMVEQAEAEHRVLLTRDVHLMQRRLLPRNQAYLVHCTGKREQLREVLDVFGLGVRTGQLLTRCIKCNGEFVPEPLGPKEAAAAAPWSQVLPEAALKAYTRFWQCSVCRHIYWEGTQFERAIRQFVGMCSLDADVSNAASASVEGESLADKAA